MCDVENDDDDDDDNDTSTGAFVSMVTVELESLPRATPFDADARKGSRGVPPRKGLAAGELRV